MSRQTLPSFLVVFHVNDGHPVHPKVSEYFAEIRCDGHAAALEEAARRIFGPHATLHRFAPWVPNRIDISGVTRWANPTLSDVEYSCVEQGAPSTGRRVARKPSANPFFAEVDKLRARFEADTQRVTDATAGLGLTFRFVPPCVYVLSHAKTGTELRALTIDGLLDLVTSYRLEVER